MELGTGLGVVATYAAGRIGSDRVFTYEANPALAPLTRDTFELNRVSPAFETCLLGEAPGETTFYVGEDFRVSSTIPSDIDSPIPIRIPVKSLNDELQRIRPTFLIVDIEGGEHDLIQHMNFAGIRKILVEVHENVIGAAKVERLKSMLLDAGFTMDTQISAPTCWFLTRPAVAES
jgi:FkbM family methyltransferase